MANTQERIDVPVLIVGGGPVGLLLAYLLSQLDVSTLIIEKYPQRLAAPKAHALSPRTLEICRQFGLDTAALRRMGSPRRDAFWVNFVTTLGGEHVGVLPYERMDPQVLEHTPEMIHNLPQPEFEAFVAEELRKGGRAEVRKGWGFVESTEDSAGQRVVTVIEERGSKRRVEVRSQYVVGCDGAKSAVRQSLGIECDGEDSYEAMMTIHFRADLRPVLGPNVGMLHWMLDPAVSGFIIGYDLGGNEVLISNFDPKKRPADQWTEADCRRVLGIAVGKDTPLKVESWRPWILSRKVARQYRKGRVFLAGDAAHSFPPTGGLGLNTGLADAHNLAYKLAKACHGADCEALLDSYDSERRPVAQICAQQSVKNGQKIFGFLKTLGLASAGSEEEARAQLMASIHDSDKRVAILEEVEAQREHFDNLELHIGYVYGSDKIPSHASHYRPKFVKGARLPHAFINILDSKRTPSLRPLDLSYVDELNEAKRAQLQYSTLDLCRPDTLTLITGSQPEWHNLAEELHRRLNDVGLKVQLFQAGVDFSFISKGHEELFDTEAGLMGSGGLLIRPDQHILERVSTDMTASDLYRIVAEFVGIGQ